MVPDQRASAPTPELPPGLDLLWGRRNRGRRGPKPGLTIDAIIEAAVRLADSEGLAAVSMARLAKELGFTTMSLYRYFSSKDEILQLMWNASAHGAEEIVLEGENWRQRLRMWAIVRARGARSTSLDHADADGCATARPEFPDLCRTWP